MTEQSYILFKLLDRLYGLPSDPIIEIFLIPMIDPVVAVRPDVVGVVNVRGDLYPVVDLSYQLGLGHHRLQVSDSLIVLRQGDRCSALIVSDVFDVVPLAVTVDRDQIWPGDAQAAAPNLALVAGMTHLDGQVITLLNPAALMASQPTLEPEEAEGATEVARRRLFPDATDFDGDRLRERAENLRHRLDDSQTDQLSALAVVELQGEPLALPVELIREFTTVPAVTPIPCCPPHIIGNINLRGEILTLLDVHPLLQGQSSQTATWAHAVVVEVDDIVAGIVVNTVLDVMYVPPDGLKLMPIATTHYQDGAYLRGVVSYGDRPVRVLDVHRLLTNPELVVNDTAA